MFKNYRFAWKILRFLPCFLCVMFARFVDKTSYYFCKKGNKCIIQFVLQTQLFKRICFIYSWWNSQLIFIIALVTLFDWSPFYFSCCVQFILTEKKKTIQFEWYEQFVHMLDICSVCFFLHFDVEMDVREKNVLKINEILEKCSGYLIVI